MKQFSWYQKFITYQKLIIQYSTTLLKCMRVQINSLPNMVEDDIDLMQVSQVYKDLNAKKLCKFT